MINSTAVLLLRCTAVLLRTTILVYIYILYILHTSKLYLSIKSNNLNSNSIFIKLKSEIMLYYISLLTLFPYPAAASLDFASDVINGPGTFENIVPDGWFKNDEEVVDADTGNILFMTDSHWDSYRRDTERFLVFFHASDCKWCTYSKPGFTQASRKFRRSMPFLAIDCKGSGAGICSKLGVLSFPRLKYFQKNVDEPEDQKYFENGPKDSGDFVTFVESKLDEAERQQFGLIGDNVDVTKILDATADVNKLKKLRVKQLRKMLKERGQRCVGCTDKSEYVQRVKDSLHLPVLMANEQKQRAGGAVGATGKKRRRKTLMQEKRERTLRKKAKIGWSKEEHGNGNVIHSHDGHFEEFYLSKQRTLDRTKEGRIPGALVFFYAPWCHHCVPYKSKLVQLSYDIKNSEKYNDQFNHIDIIAIDGDGSKELAGKYKIKTFPTFMFFRNGKLDMELFDQEGRPREPKHLIKFFHRLEDINWMPSPEGKFNNIMRWGEGDIKVERDNGNVIFMTQEHWEKYRSDGHFDQGAMVLFYTEWCHHCKDMKPHYAQVSRLLKQESEENGRNVQVVAMDCDGYGRDVCRKKYGIQSFPTMYFFYPKKNVENNPNLNEYEEYEGPRDYETVTKMIKERVQENYVYYNAKIEEGGGIQIEKVENPKKNNNAKISNNHDEEAKQSVPSTHDSHDLPAEIIGGGGAEREK
jgi:thiol-disulfide isomerase/thioredoxin